MEVLTHQQETSSVSCCLIVHAVQPLQNKTDLVDVLVKGLLILLICNVPGTTEKFQVQR